MRTTLEQLKAMSNDELYKHWNKSEFPFDAAGGCHQCLTMHRYYQLNFPLSLCRLPEHKDLLANVAKFTAFPSTAMLREHLEELYALRLFYDSLYQQEPLCESEPSPDTATVAVGATKP